MYSPVCPLARSCTKFIALHNNNIAVLFSSQKLTDSQRSFGFGWTGEECQGMHNCFINHLTLMSGLIYFSISRKKAAKDSFNKRCHDLVCKHNIGNMYGGYCWLCLFHITI